MKQTTWDSSWTIGHNQLGNVKGWSAGIDAVTVIGQDHHSALLFYNEYDNIKTRLNLGKVVDKTWGMHGYRGKQCHSVRIGLKDDKTILMVTGPEAERVFNVSKRVNVKYTRVDLQVTIELSDPARLWAHEHYHAPNLRGNRERGKLYTSLINSPDGDTLYLNKRTSPTFGRMYDKSREFMADYGSHWRFEVEAKEETSDRLGHLLEHLTEYEQIAADYVVGWFGDRAICVPLGPRDTVSIPELPSRVTGFTQTLDWLRRQVKPALNVLEQAGLQRDAENALGIQLTFPEQANDTED